MQTAAPPIKQAVVSGVSWTALAQFSRVALHLGSTTVYAWCLGPDVFGLLGMAAVVVGFLMIFRDLGTGAAIVQRESVDDSLLSTLFWTNLGIGLAGTLLLFFTAPGVSWFFADAELTLILQALAPSLLLVGMSIVQQSLLQRQLKFQSLAQIEVLALLLGTAVGVTAAFLGAGAWALVLQTLVTTALTTLLVWGHCAWRPKFIFRNADLRSVASFGANLTSFQLLNYFTRNMDQLLIAKLLGRTELGYYALACRMLLVPLQSVNTVISRVMFPLYSRIQNDQARFANAWLKVTGVTAMLMFPCLGGLFVVREPLVLGLFGEAWSPMLPVLAALAVVGMAQSVVTSVSLIYQAKNRTGLMLCWGVFAGICVVAAFVVGLRWGVAGVAQSFAVVAVLLAVPGLYIPLRLIGVPLRKLGKVLWRPALVTALMMLCTWLVGQQLPPFLPALSALLVMIIVGALSYLAFSRWLNRRQWGELWLLVRRRRAE